VPRRDSVAPMGSNGIWCSDRPHDYPGQWQHGVGPGASGPGRHPGDGVSVGRRHTITAIKVATQHGR